MHAWIIFEGVEPLSSSVINSGQIWRFLFSVHLRKSIQIGVGTTKVLRFVPIIPRDSTVQTGTNPEHAFGSRVPVRSDSMFERICVTLRSWNSSRSDRSRSILTEVSHNMECSANEFWLFLRELATSEIQKVFAGLVISKMDGPEKGRSICFIGGVCFVPGRPCELQLRRELYRSKPSDPI